MTIKGKAVLCKVDGITYSAGISVAGTENPFNQSLEFERTGNNSYVKNDNGDDVAGLYANKGKTFTITVVPGGTNISDVRSLTDKFLLAPGTTVTVADTETTVVDGTYNVVSSRLARANEGPGTVVLVLEKRDDNDITGTVS
jgi:hypothetical protein